MVDDEPLVALVVRRTLESAYEVTVLRSGREALAHLAAGHRYDAILTDLRMRDGDGLWLREELQKLDREQAQRMIFLSGAPDASLAQQGARFLLKPFRTAELIAQIEAVVSPC